MLLRDELLIPIAAPAPTGVDLRYDPLYDKIKEARREDDDAPQGDWRRPRKTADWSLVAKLSTDVLATKSKDLQVAVWLTEAQVRRQGFAGLRDGLAILEALLVEFWDGLYPPLEEGNAELRAVPLEWIGSYLGSAAMAVPLTRSGFNCFKYKESRAVGSEAEAGDDTAKLAARARAIEEGRVTAEAFDQAVDSTPTDWYKQLTADLTGAIEQLASLEDTGRKLFGDVAPSYARLRGALDEVQRVAEGLLTRKLTREASSTPDTLTPDVVSGPGAATPPGAPRGSADQARLAPGATSAEPRMTVSPEPVDLNDAAARIASAARFLRRTNPRSPVSYLLLRGFRWGELRAVGPPPDPRVLEAPPPDVRSLLKRRLLDRQWPELLDGCEDAMTTPAGRGWLDLQRYAITACEGLGRDFARVAEALDRALRDLLSEIPQLPKLTLMDDTPAANADTQAWLHGRWEVVDGSQESVGEPEDDTGNAGPETAPTDGRRNGMLARALAEVHAGRPERAIELLTGEVATAGSKRGRFLGKTELAALMVDAGFESVAKPVLEELVAEIDAHQLEEWEDPNTLSQPMALLHRCIEQLEGDGGRPAAQTLYLRICRIDPLRAVRLARH